MRKTSIFIISFLLLVSGLSAQSGVFNSTGSAKTEYAALQAAILGLVNQIEVRVKSRTGSAIIVEGQDSQSKSDFASISDLLVESNVVLMGLKYDVQTPSKEGGSFVVKARLEADYSLPLYRLRLADLARQIKVGKDLVDAKGSTNKELYVRAMARLLDEYQRYRWVAIALGADDKELESVPLNAIELAAQQTFASQTIDTMEKAALRLTEGIALYSRKARAKVYVDFSPSQGSDVNQAFGNALRMYVESVLVNQGVAVMEKPDNAVLIVSIDFAAVVSARDQSLQHLEAQASLYEKAGSNAGLVRKNNVVRILPQAASSYSY